ncbi:hypothetical protein NDU88_002193 [Pleurodeles waltl]|uniref:Uncharacterized protein n=1 Tax=Pleurodeles waltl TaxID=8319 RepID=A0AAV7UAC9_PLEWA|nr:hypothetical protein NDU88_002193 [Pleurodeles waltl]
MVRWPPDLQEGRFGAARRVAESAGAPDESSGAQRTARGLVRVGAVSEASASISRLACWACCWARPGGDRQLLALLPPEDLWTVWPLA